MSNNEISKINSGTLPKENLYFAKEVARYFMDFLETDFHRRRTPRRTIRFRNNDNLLVGLNLSKYPSFNSLIWKLINQVFNKDPLKVIKGRYRTNIPNNLLDLIKLQTKKISNKQISAIIQKISEEIEKNVVLNKKDYEKALNDSLEDTSRIIRNKLVLPFITNLEKPLENLDLGDENNIYLMEEELTSVLVSAIENQIAEIIKRLLAANKKIDIQKELKAVFNIEEIKDSINNFFTDFKVTDLFSELFEMERNRNILDKQEFYLYFCDITFNKAKYPIFYIPFSLERDGNELKIKFDSQVYINKKALEYIIQEYNRENGKGGNLKIISERIIYLAQHKEDFKEFISSILTEIVNFFELDTNIDVSDPRHQTAKGFWTRISNTCYIALFDKSDEALINDYEEILQKLSEEDDVLVNAFNALIEDFVHKNPKTFDDEIVEEWDSTEISDRLVFRSPVPLNSEQRQILSAVKKDGCKYIIVEGPPGTGKSHTITAVIFEAILKNQSVLVLSDKKEALDVVEKKITDTMNKVRRGKNFQNPILRLGKIGNYPRILAIDTIQKIKVNYLAVKKNNKELKEDIEKLERTIKEDIEAEILAYKDINIKEIYELSSLEVGMSKDLNIIDFKEVLGYPDSAVEIEEVRKIFKKFRDKIFSPESKLLQALQFFGLKKDRLNSRSNFDRLIDDLQQTQEITKKVKSVYNKKIKILSLFPEFSKANWQQLKELVEKYKNLKNPIFGYFLKGNQIAALDLEFKKIFPYAKINTPHKHLEELIDIVDIFGYIAGFCGKKNNSEIDCVKVVHVLLQDQSFFSILKEVFSLQEDLDYLQEISKKYPNTFKKLGIDLTNLKSLAKNAFLKIGDSEFNKLIRYITLKQKIGKGFQNIPRFYYERLRKNLEDLVTFQMTYIMDGRLVNFWDKCRNDAITMREIIQSKKKFDKNEFQKLKNAFPVILAGIRDYAEYIPLAPEIFDLVIIDEASQVSIAQAFPALLRAKKVLVLGDRKQFCNVKSSQARTDINREYLHNLQDIFKKTISLNQTKLEKLTKFNIKTSILEFFEFISNYHVQLLKHFRGYKENISFSNKYFYRDNLQIMKIRAKSIDEVLKFSFVKHDGKIEPHQNTNVPEAKFIIGELKKLKEANNDASVCIITPHTNQQKLLMEMVNKLPERDYFFKKLKLKIFTFDTCQGEERDIVFYSMVATEKSDRLWGVFLQNLNLEEEALKGNIKAQRLNVGFSRAKECMHFVLSKPLDKFSGYIGEALRYYYRVLQEAKKEPLPNEVDAKSPMEKQVLNWLTQTDFWKDNFPQNILLKPQFKLGEYLRQLDENYNHPNYVVDFLLVYKDKTHREHKIVIEYDGFEEHFKRAYEVNEFNYQDYYSDDDIYRQKVLESYSYKFLRINKFNIGKDPITTLNTRLINLIKGNQYKAHSRIAVIHETIEGLQNGEMKECPKCKELRSIEDFRDPSLITGYGRFCNYCKEATKKKETKKKISIALKTEKNCPRCGSRMVLRNGRYGKFYGCSRFPYCRGTRPYFV